MKNIIKPRLQSVNRHAELYFLVLRVLFCSQFLCFDIDILPFSHNERPL